MKCLTIEEALISLKQPRDLVSDEIVQHCMVCKKCCETEQQAGKILLKEAREQDGVIKTRCFQYDSCGKCKKVTWVYRLPEIFDYHSGLLHGWLCASCFKDFLKENAGVVHIINNLKIKLLPNYNNGYTIETPSGQILKEFRDFLDAVEFCQETLVYLEKERKDKIIKTHQEKINHHLDCIKELSSAK